MLNTWRLMWLCALFLLLACGPAEKKPFCGDGVVNPGEECDDGNNFLGDGCIACRVEQGAACGNGIIDEGEQCDGADFSGQSCATLGLPGGVLACIGCFIDTSGCAVCGDAIVSAGEQCDDGNTTNGDGCENDCSLTPPVSCGDGVVQPPEECDNGALNSNISPNACRLNCTNPRCGDDVIDSSLGEACDPPGGGCDTSCQLIVPVGCGDGVVSGGESCDDGNNTSGDGCDAICNDEFCGDGLVNDGNEQCEDGNQIETDSCTSNCRFASCGDGFIQAGVEACDDGNTQNGDGCDSNCLLQQPVFNEVAPTQVTNLFCHSDYSNSGRKVALDEAGRIYVAMICGASPRAFVAVSNDQGQNYGPPVDIIGNPFFETNTPFEVAVEGGPGNTAYAAVITTDSRLLFTHTVDGGQSWEPPVTLDSGFIAGTGSGLSLVAFGDTILVGINQSIQTSEADGVRIFRNDNRGTGAFASHDSIQHVVFFEVLRAPTTGAIYAVSEEPTMNVRRSTDGGVSFGAENSPRGRSSSRIGRCRVIASW